MMFGNIKTDNFFGKVRVSNNLYFVRNYSATGVYDKNHFVTNYRKTKSCFSLKRTAPCATFLSRDNAYRLKTTKNLYYVSTEQGGLQTGIENEKTLFQRAMKYLKGDTVPRDFEESFRCFQLVVEQGPPSSPFVAKALNNIGVFYYAGYGVGQNFEKAKEWFEKAAALNYAKGQFNLGLLYYNGHGVTKDYAKAKEWLEKAAAQNFAKAQYNLGLLYESGLGVEKDSEKAKQWFEKAAAQDFVLADYKLTILRDQLTENVDISTVK